MQERNRDDDGKIWRREAIKEVSLDNGGKINNRAMNAVVGTKSLMKENQMLGVRMKKVGDEARSMSKRNKEEIKK